MRCARGGTGTFLVHWVHRRVVSLLSPMAAQQVQQRKSELEGLEETIKPFSHRSGDSVSLAGRGWQGGSRDKLNTLGAPDQW